MITPMSEVKQKEFNDENMDDLDNQENPTSRKRLNVQNIRSKHMYEGGERETQQERHPAS
jgi:hypothetical protein